MLERVLVANRGEIARRVIRTCRRLGVATVAVYSDADAGEPHVREADTAVRLGPAPATDSYLRIDRLVEAARTTGCDAVHPGYGFLAENAAFAEAVIDAGLAFVGPSPAVIRLMGDKAAAKRRLTEAGVAVVPGLDADTLGDDDLVAAAGDVGFPLLVKAVAGGGGKGMRAVHDPAELPDALAAARREAKAAFGDERVILERLVSAPRHIEVQVFGDRHGQVVHLLERECSVQRRHQKVVEETPSPAVDEALRTRMGAAAVAAAQAVDYEGAGTVEFLVAGDTLDQDEPEFFFLEMNTRLQVEHPVTELVTGLDLVELQLRVAAGEPLGIEQEQVRADGHALEVRLYAEDPVAQLPQTGTVASVHVPDAHDVRADLGIEAGSRVGRFYDPMLGKLIVHAPDRQRSCQRMAWLLGRTTVHGVVTNLDLLAAIVDHPTFVAGELTTGFLDDHLADWEPAPAPDVSLVAAAIAVQDAVRREGPAGDPHRPWDTLGPFRPGRVGGWRLTLADGDREVTLAVTARGDRRWVRLGDRDVEVVVLARRGTHGSREPDGSLHLEVDGQEVPARVTVVHRGLDTTQVWVHAAGVTRRLTVVAPTRHADPAELAGGTAFASPMPGAVLSVAVTAGEQVAAGTTMLVVEAMKMEHPIVAPSAGTVIAVHVTTGDGVDAGAPLLAFEPDLASDPEEDA
jgi:acetyl-CoA/propionyl-CoA carboxylase, biotin carboxylase, biotin carboxyl carrier protein